MNRYRIAEKLRPVWEENADTNKELESGEIKVTLLDNAGGKTTDISLRVDVDRLKKFINDRIAICVDNFVESIQKAFDKLDEAKKKNLCCPFHIFLAGNSSKSHFVKDLMLKKLLQIQNNFEGRLAKERPEDTEFFCIHAPLGLDDNEVSNANNKIADFAHTPTGKTGVAFGLVESAPGRRIKILNSNITASGEIHFRYYVGRERRGTLQPCLNPDSLDTGWVNFCSAGKADGISYLYYTRDGRATTGNFQVKDAFCTTIEFEPTNGRILIRVSGVSEIEWCIGIVNDDGECIPNKNFSPNKIVLNEGI